MRVVLFLLLTATCGAFPHDESRLSDDEIEEYVSLSAEGNRVALEHQIIYIDHVTDKSPRQMTRDTIVGETSSFKFRAFDEDFHIDVTEESDIFVNNTASCNIVNSEGKVKIEEIPTSCFYHGNVRGHEKSIVAMSTCEGLTASITRFGHKDLYIETLSDDHAMKRGIQKGVGHIAYRHAQRQTFECVVDDDGLYDVNVNAMGPLPEMYVKVHIVADHAYYAIRGADSCRCLIATFMATARRLEMLPNLHARLDGVDIITSQSVLNTLSKDSYHNLKVIKEWLKTQPLRANWDHVALIVPQNMEVAGRAYYCGVCGDVSKVSVSSCIYMIGVQTLAHEIGHNLCMNHNTRKPGCMINGFTMGAALYNEIEQGWAQCSVDEFKSSIVNKQCLSDM